MWREQEVKLTPMESEETAINEIKKRSEGSGRWRKSINQYARALWIEATKNAGTMTEQEKIKTRATIVTRMERKMTAASINIET